MRSLTSSRNSRTGSSTDLPVAGKTGWRVHAVEPRSQANGPGVRFVVWSQGCTLGCPGCFNPGTHPVTAAGAGEWPPGELAAAVEEQRAIAMLDEVRRSRDSGSDLITWDVAERFGSKAGRKLPEAADPVGALDKIAEQATGAPERRDLFVLKDFHEFYSKDARVRRKLRSLAQRLMFTGSSLVVITPVRSLPPELRDEAVLVEMPLPDEAALRGELDGLISTSGVRVRLPVQGRARLAQAALGLTLTQAKRAFAKAIVRDRGLDERAIDAVLEEKKAVIRESQALEFYPAEQTPDDVGGLDS